MGRKTKVALSYFPLDCDFFSNRKVKALRRAHGQIGLLTYVYILCRIYANGYYLKVEDMKQFAYDVAEDIANDHLASVSARVMNAISYLADTGLLDKACLDKGVLTGYAIQEQYIRSITASKRTAQIQEYRVTDSAFPVQKTGKSSEEKRISSEEMAINSETTQQRKRNETTAINSCCYGLHGLVRLTDTEYGRIREEIGEIALKDYINRLDSWLTGHKVSGSHANVILKWYNQDNRDKPKGTGQTVSAVDVNALFGNVTEDTI